MDIVTEIASHLVGRHLIEVERRDFDWVFTFPNAGLVAECPWRILCEGRIAHTNTDHAQKFGLPEPIDGEAESNRLLQNKTVESVTIREDTGDLTITFAGPTALEILNMSSGYEGWQFNASNLLVVAAGGGRLSIYRDGSPRPIKE